MKRKICSCLIVLSLLLSSLSSVVSGAETPEIVILFESDVHCSVDGYAKIAALKDEMSDEAEYVALVTSGDFIQGGSLGIVSKGEYIINIMNLIGYDAVGLGNHEFDYKTERLHELIGILESPVVCSNYKKIGEEKSVFDPYIIVPYGDVEIAYIGITTPDTITSSSPAQFKNEEGQYTYTFCADTLYENVQKSIDNAKKDGADYIIALAHLGTEYVYEQWSAQALIQNTSGLDVVLDGHSHSVVEGMTVNDKAGNDVVVASTGTGFANMGKLTISDGIIKTELIPTETYEKTDDEVTKYLNEIKEEYAKYGERKIGTSEVTLTTSDENGTRLIRNGETNMGDFCADAYRIITGADIGLINGGGIRGDIDEGDITFNELLGIFPYSNKTCVSEVTGQQLVDLLEYAFMLYPEENGTFQQVSGISFDFDPLLPQPVKVDENEAFVSVDGNRRISDVKVLNSETGEYEPIDLNGKYTMASHGYLLMENGGGTTMLKDSTLLSDTGILDIELLENYITENLNGIVGSEYAQSQDRINILDEYIPLRKSFEEKGYEVIWNALEPKKIIVKTDNSTVIFMADTNVVTVDENNFESDRIAYIENGITYISADCLNLCK